MNSFKKYLSISLMFFIVVSCGGNSSSGEESLYLMAKEELNSRNYSKANKLFEELVQKYPGNRKYQQALADTFLGIGGFELFDFLISIDRLVGGSFNSQNLLLEIKGFVEKYFFIGLKRKTNLIRALNIYYKLDAKYVYKSKEDKLKKGLVHIFLLTQSLKELIYKLENVAEKGGIDDIEAEYKKFIGKYVVHVDGMIFHSFKAYLNLKESFEEINSLLSELDRAIFDVFGIPYNKIKGEFSNMSIEKFVSLFIKYNPELYEEIMKKVLSTCKRELALKKILILEDTIEQNYQSHEFKDSLLKTVRTLRKYIESHDQDVCNSIM